MRKHTPWPWEVRDDPAGLREAIKGGGAVSGHAKKIRAAAQAFNKAVQAAASDGMKVEWWMHKKDGQPAMVENITVRPMPTDSEAKP